MIIQEWVLSIIILTEVILDSPWYNFHSVCIMRFENSGSHYIYTRIKKSTLFFYKITTQGVAEPALLPLWSITFTRMKFASHVHHICICLIQCTFYFSFTFRIFSVMIYRNSDES